MGDEGSWKGEEKRGSFFPGPEDEMEEKKERELGDVKEKCLMQGGGE